MKKLLKRFDILERTSFLTILITLVAFIATIPLFFLNLMDVPLGILLGGTISSVSYLIYKVGKNSYTLGSTIVMNIIKFFVIITLMGLLVYMYYKEGEKVFNPFAFVGMYFVSTICLLVSNILDKEGA